MEQVEYRLRDYGEGPHAYNSSVTVREFDHYILRDANGKLTYVKN